LIGTDRKDREKEVTTATKESVVLLAADFLLLATERK
jgi:hypothetical protein